MFIGEDVILGILQHHSVLKAFQFQFSSENKKKLLEKSSKEIIKNPQDLKDKTMPDKFIYIPIDTQNYPFGRLYLMVEMFGHST